MALPFFFLERGPPRFRLKKKPKWFYHGLNLTSFVSVFRPFPPVVSRVSQHVKSWVLLAVVQSAHQERFC